MINHYDALGIYDRLSMVRLKMQEMTQLTFMLKEGIQRMDAVSNLSCGCFGSLYTLLDGTTESLNEILKEFEKILDEDKTEE